MLLLSLCGKPDAFSFVYSSGFWPGKVCLEAQKEEALVIQGQEASRQELCELAVVQLQRVCVCTL